MSSIQRSLNTLQYYTGTQNGVLIIEVFAIQRFVIEVPLYCTGLNANGNIVLDTGIIHILSFTIL